MIAPLLNVLIRLLGQVPAGEIRPGLEEQLSAQVVGVTVNTRPRPIVTLYCRGTIGVQVDVSFGRRAVKGHDEMLGIVWRAQDQCDLFLLTLRQFETNLMQPLQLVNANERRMWLRTWAHPW